jgi:hypothetical protein
MLRKFPSSYLLADRSCVTAGAADSVKARGGDSARSDELSACSARLGSPESPSAVGAFARFSDGQTASSFTSDNGDLAFAAAQQQHMGTQLGTEANEEQLADWEIPEHQLRCSRLWDGHMDAQPAAPARLLRHLAFAAPLP